MASLERYRPLVLAHHRRSHADFTPPAIGIAEELLPAPLARLQMRAYRRTRVALPPGVAALARHAMEHDARLLHFHFLTDARFLLGIQRRTGLPSIVSAYGYDVSSFPRSWSGLGRRYLAPIFKRLDCFLAMSEDMKQDLLALGCPEEKILVHYYGSDVRRFRCHGRSYDRAGPLTVLYCGQLHSRKAPQLVMHALRLVERSGRGDFRVTFVGDGVLRPELERLVAAYGWEERVMLAGHVPYTDPALVAHYHEADVFTLPSHTDRGDKEGIPGTVVEAMAAGLPVVATWHAGIPSVIDSGRDGLLVPERDVDALAAAFAQLFDDARARERLGRAAAARAADELDLAARTAALERIYDRFV
jgi:colanic acid/amylovoran biosynthesis glycosyltransferase